jgi:hypothetical protein
MLSEKFWTFIRDNVISLITVIVGVIVLVFQGIGNASDQMVLGTTLALVVLLATSEVVERQLRLSKIEQSLRDQKEALIGAIDGVAVKELLSEEMYEFMRFMIATAKESVFWASPEPRRGTAQGTKRTYEEAIDQLAKDGHVRFSYISHFSGKARAKRALRLLFKYEDNSKIFIGSLPAQEDSFPLFSFLIFDRKTLVTRAPYGEGTEGRYYAISNPTTVELFMDYFERLLDKSEKLIADKETKSFLQKIVDD